MAQRLPVLLNQKPCYDIVFAGSFEGLGEELEELKTEEKKICIVTDSNVGKLYGKEAFSVLQGKCAKAVIYEFPAGLVEKKEDYHDAAVRELREETGLKLELLNVPGYMEKPLYTTIGMTDECCAMVYGYASGTICTDGEEDSEEIEVVLVDRKEAKRILKEEKVAMMCAYMLMHFIASEDPFYFLKCDEDRDI